MLDRPEEVEVIKEENEKKNVKGFRNGILVGALGTILILAGICAGIIGFRLFAIRGTQAGIGAKGSSIINTETLQKIQTIEAAIDNYYFYEDDVSSQDLQDGIYKGMVEALGDPYSKYYTKEELEEALNSNKGI